MSSDRSQIQRRRLWNLRALKLMDIVLGSLSRHVYVFEHPKSGGTWLARMLAHCLNVDTPDHELRPVVATRVIHSHGRPHRRLARAILLVRDGRDVMVSLFFQRMRQYRDPQRTYTPEAIQQRYDQAFGEGFDPSDIRNLLPKFIELELTQPLDIPLNWAQYCQQWQDHGRPVATVKYESLLDDAAGSLRQCLQAIGRADVSRQRISEAVERFSFKNVAGRESGSEDRDSFYRKGIAGDWVNHFSPEAAEVFHRLGGEALIRLGYETDADWVERVRNTAAVQQVETNG